MADHAKRWKDSIDFGCGFWQIVEDELVDLLSRGRIDGDQFEVGLATHHRPGSDVLHESGNASPA